MKSIQKKILLKKLFNKIIYNLMSNKCMLHKIIGESNLILMTFLMNYS